MKPVVHHLAVDIGIITIYVAAKRGPLKRMIKARIEYTLLPLGTAFNLNLAKQPAPCVAGGIMHGGEILSGHLFLQIHLGIIDTDKRESDLHLQRIFRAAVKKVHDSHLMFVILNHAQ